MNTEQVEGQLGEYKDKLVAIGVPIRGTCHMTFYGNLTISENWESGDTFILYSVRYWPDCDINFRAQRDENHPKKPHPR